MNSIKSSLSDCVILTFPKIEDSRGNLTFIEGFNHVPFDIKRVFYIYDIPTNTQRGAHAHKNLVQLIFPISGSLDVCLHDGKNERLTRLNRPWLGLLIPPGIWAYECNFDPGTTYMVLASELYDENDYIRSFDSFVNYKSCING